MSISIPELTTNLNIHQTLDDQPSLSANELKTAWDKPVNDIKDYLNNLLIPVLQDMADAVDGLDERIGDLITAKWQERYYVGSIIVSSISKNPSTYLGFGTWELTGKGRVEIGVDPDVTAYNAGDKTGGNEKITLAANQIPTLTIGQAVTNVTASTNNNADLTYVQGTVVTAVAQTKTNLKYTNSSQQQVNITPKYVTVYRYKRTA